MYCPAWLPSVISYDLVLSYVLSVSSDIILGESRLSLMVSSMLSLEASVVTEQMPFTCNQGLVTKVMVTGRREGFKRRPWKNKIVPP